MTIKLYVVFVDGFAVGCESVLEFNPVLGVQEYVFPATVGVPRIAPPTFVLQLTVASSPALAVGGILFTVTTI